MLTNLQARKNRSDSYNQMVFNFIREADRFIDAISRRAVPVNDKNREETETVIKEIAESRIVSKQISSSLAALNQAVEDQAYQNAILGIQRALNEIIWKFSGIRRYCIHVIEKGGELPDNRPLNHMVNQLNGEIFRAIRKITDSLELASERYFGLERTQDDEVDIGKLQNDFSLLEQYQPSHEAAYILIESQKYRIRDILHMFGEEPGPAVEKRNRESQVREKRPAQQEPEPHHTNGAQLEKRVEEVEQELTSTMLKMQSRIDEMNAAISGLKVSGKKEISRLFNEHAEQVQLDEQERLSELKQIRKQVDKIVDMQETLEFRVQQSDERLGYVIAIPARVEQLEKKSDSLSDQIQNIMGRVNEKISEIRYRPDDYNNGRSELLHEFRRDIDDLNRKMADSRGDINSLNSKVLRIEDRAEILAENLQSRIDERVNQAVRSVKEDFHVLMRRRIHKTLRKYDLIEKNGDAFEDDEI